MQMQPISPQGMLPVSAENPKSNETKESMDSLLAFFSSSNSSPDKESTIEPMEKEKLSTDKEPSIQAHMDNHQSTEESRFDRETSALPQTDQTLSAQFPTKDIINFVDEHFNIDPLVTNLVAEVEQHIPEGVRKFMADDVPQILKQDILQYLADKVLVDIIPGEVDHTVAELKGNDLPLSGNVESGKSGITENILTDDQMAKSDILFPPVETAKMQEQAHVLQNHFSETISLKDLEPLIRREAGETQQRRISQTVGDQLLGLQPENAETIQLKAQNKMDPTVFQPDSLAGQIIADEVSSSVQKMNSPLRSEDLRLNKPEHLAATEANSLPAKASAQVSDPIDPRFADLLLKPAKAQSEALPDIVPLKLRNASVNGDNPRNTFIAGQEAKNQETVLSFAGKDSSGSNFESSGNNPQSAKPNIVPSFSSNMATAETGEIVTSGVALSQSTIPQPTTNTQDTAAIRLPSGAFVSESKIVDHVIEHVSIRSHNGANSITIKMHPEELGRLKMDLTVDKDVVKAHIQTQSIQVQEVLEKYISRLRDGFDQQGLKLDEIQVSIDSDRSTDHGLFQEHRNGQANIKASNPVRMDKKLETSSNDAIARSTSTENGISLRI